MIGTFDCWHWNNVPEWLTAIGTLLVAFVAVFQDWLRGLVFRPRLQIEKPRVGRPDSEKTMWGDKAAVYYFRLAITNQGNAEACDVQVALAEVMRKRADNEYERAERFSPMNLVWAHMGGKITLPVLWPKMPPRFCDLAHITSPAGKSLVGEELPGVAATDPVLALDLEVKPNTRGHLLEPGYTYLFKLKLAASNYSPRDYTLEVNFEKGRWLEDESKMFSEGFGMRLV